MNDDETAEEMLARWDRESDEDERDRLQRQEERRRRESAPGYVPPPTAAELERLRCHPAWSATLTAARRPRKDDPSAQRCPLATERQPVAHRGQSPTPPSGFEG